MTPPPTNLQQLVLDMLPQTLHGNVQSHGGRSAGNPKGCVLRPLETIRRPVRAFSPPYDLQISVRHLLPYLGAGAGEPGGAGVGASPSPLPLVSSSPPLSPPSLLIVLAFLIVLGVATPPASPRLRLSAERIVCSHQPGRLEDVEKPTLNRWSTRSSTHPKTLRPRPTVW